MNNCIYEAKKKLQNAGVKPEALEIMINLCVNPDNNQILAEEIFKLREENEILSYEKEELKKATVDFISEIKKFLLEISNMNFDKNEFKVNFKNLQGRTKEAYKILELMEMLNE